MYLYCINLSSSPSFQKSSAIQYVFQAFFSVVFGLHSKDLERALSLVSVISYGIVGNVVAHLSKD